MEQKKLSIIIVDYNCSELIKDCIQSILKFKPGLDYDIIVVDNASRESHLKEYEKLSNNIFGIRAEKNKGFGSGNNLGAKKANGEYLLLLNPDTILIENSLSKMVNFIENHQEIAALTCLLGPNREDLQKAFFGRFQSLLGLTFRHYNYQKIDLGSEFFYTDIVTGACLLIKRDLFDKVGGFDENIFMYLEDDDLCKRLVKAGYKNAVLTTTKILHLEGQTTKIKERKKIYYESQNYYWKKHNGVFITLLMRLIRWPYKLLKAGK